MPENDLLFIVAEIAVAFAGFAGLVAVISARPDKSEEQAGLELGLLANVLGQSLIAVAFALIPAAVAGMGVDADIAFRGAAVAFIVAQAAYMGLWMPRGLAAYKALQIPMPKTLRLNMLVLIVQLAILVLCASAIIPSTSYLAALLLSLYFSGSSFIRVFVSIGQNVQTKW